METDTFIEKLKSKKYKERLSATKEIGNKRLNKYAIELFQAYTKEAIVSRLCQTQSTMIRSLGLRKLMMHSNLLSQLFTKIKNMTVIQYMLQHMSELNYGIKTMPNQLLIS